MNVYVRLIGMGILLTVLVSACTAVGVVSGIGDAGIRISQLAAFTLAAVCFLFFMKRKDPSLQQFGFRRKKVDRFFYVFGVGIILIQPLVLGLNTGLPKPMLVIIVLQMALVGFTEEILFRGIFLYYLQGRGAKSFVIFSSLVFGILHAAGGLDPEAAGYVIVLQIIHALLIGAVFAVIYYITRTIYLVIGFHAVFDITASLTAPGTAVQDTAAVLLLVIGYGLFFLYIKWRYYAPVPV